MDAGLLTKGKMNSSLKIQSVPLEIRKPRRGLIVDFQLPLDGANICIIALELKALHKNLTLLGSFKRLGCLAKFNQRWSVLYVQHLRPERGGRRRLLRLIVNGYFDLSKLEYGKLARL